MIGSISILMIMSFFALVLSLAQADKNAIAKVSIAIINLFIFILLRLIVYHLLALIGLFFPF
ncbi:hypothetical protein L950_0213475 [Sphingobacterium sp. IITKGP-BTPF85]|nr:hypothetical protein L950_0213475 [Sphingobacterium sp. IITKGP-BTPF85]